MTRWCRKLLAIIILIQLATPASAWADATYQYRSMSVIPDGTRPYQFNFTLSNSTGTNTQFTLYFNGHAQPNFTDVRFYLNDVTLLSYWMEDNTTGKVWLNVTGNGTIYTYYGKASATSYSNGTTTFLQYQSETNSEFKLANVAGSGQNIAARIKFIVNTAHDRDYFGLSNSAAYSTDDSAYFDNIADGSNYQGISFNEGVSTASALFGAYTNTVAHIYDIPINSTSVKYYMDGTYKATITTNLPNEDMGLTVKQTIAGGGTGAVLYWGFIRNYVFPELILAPWTVEASYPGNATVGNWTFDQGTGNYANDSSGYYNNGTITGATWNGTDMVNSFSLYFDGNDYVSIPTSPTMNFTSSHSFTMWIKPHNISGNHRVFDKDGLKLELAQSGDSTVLSYSLWKSGSVGLSGTSGGNVLNDTWTFISGTFQNNSLQSLYINNILIDTDVPGSSDSIEMLGSDFVVGSRLKIDNNYTGLIDEFKLYNYALNTTELTTEYQRFHPFLSYPLNGSTIVSIYPPQTATINFTWHDSEYPADEILVSTDINFNVLDVDIFTSNDFYLATLDVNKKYYWKIRQYNGTTGTYGETSTTHNFTISSTGGATGQGVQGVVYEILGGLDTPIDQATVYIYNTTWSSTAVTGTNGYYLFSDLANGTYNMYAIKNGYDTTAVFPVTVNGSITTNDILMKIYISPYVPNFVFEKFIVRDLFDRSFVGVTATVYKGDSLTASFTGTTDSTGAVVFQLIKDQRYRVTFTGGGISGTVTIYVYAKEESYYVRILTGFPTGGDRFTDISTNLTVTSFNATWSNLSLIYNDTISSTSLVQFYATNLSTGASCYTNSTSNVITLNCTVLASGTYQFGFNATSSTYGFFQQDQIINFDVGKPSTPAVDTTIDSDLLQWGSIILIVLTASLFSVRSIKYGAVIVPLEALVLWAFGWFEPVANNQAGSFLLLSCAVVIGVMIYLRQSEIKVNF